MAQTDSAVLLSQPPSPMDHIVKELRIIQILLRQGFNIQDENASLTQQDLPSTSAIGAL